jgi:hypothetical protein
MEGEGGNYHKEGIVEWFKVHLSSNLIKTKTRNYLEL